MQFDWGSVYRRLRYVARAYSKTCRDAAIADCYMAADRISKHVMRRFESLGSDSILVHPRPGVVIKAEQAYRAIQDLSRRAAVPGEAMRAYQAREALEAIRRITSDAADKLAARHGALDALSTPDNRAMQQTPPGVGPTTSAALPATVPLTTVPPVEQLDISVSAHTIARVLNPVFSELAGELVHGTGVPGPPPASGLPGPSLAEAAGARAGDLERRWLDPPATASGATATEPAATEPIVTPSFSEMSSFWLQPDDPGPPPTPSAPGRTGVGAGAPPTAAEPWHIRAPEMGGEPRPIAFDPWSAPPGPSTRVVYTEAIRTPVMSTGAPPGRRGAETPGFGRAASGAVELPFSRRQEIAHRFRTRDAVLEAEFALQTGGAGALGWSGIRWREVRDDLFRLHYAIAQSDFGAAAAMVDVDWSAIEALLPILEVPPRSP